MNKLVSAIVTAAIVSATVLSVKPSASAADPVPEKLQSVMLVKVVGHVKALGGVSKEKVTIGVLGGGSIYKLLQKAAERSKGSVTVKEVGPGDLNGVDVLFFPTGTARNVVEESKTAAVSAKVLTAGGDPQHVYDRLVTLSFELVNKKPRILINSASGKEEAVKFSARILKMADLK